VEADPERNDNLSRKRQLDRPGTNLLGFPLPTGVLRSGSDLDHNAGRGAPRTIYVKQQQPGDGKEIWAGPPSLLDASLQIAGWRRSARHAGERWALRTFQGFAPQVVAVKVDRSKATCANVWVVVPGADTIGRMRSYRNSSHSPPVDDTGLGAKLGQPPLSTMIGKRKR